MFSKRLFSNLVYALASIMIIVFIVISYRYIQYSFINLKITNAYVSADKIAVKPLYPAYIKNIYVHNGDIVSKGQPLVVLDGSIYRNKLKREESLLKGMELKKRISLNLFNRKILVLKNKVDVQMNRYLKVLDQYYIEKIKYKLEKYRNYHNIQKADINVKKIDNNINLLRHMYKNCIKNKEKCVLLKFMIKNAQYKLTKAHINLDISRLKFSETSNANYYRLKYIKHEILIEKNKLDTLRRSLKYLKVIQRDKINMLNLEYAYIKQTINLLKLKLSYFVLSSPINGVVYKIIKIPGNYVRSENTIMYLYNPNDIYITATTQIRNISYVEIGSNVEIFLPFKKVYINGIIKNLFRNKKGSMQLHIVVSKRYRSQLNIGFPVVVTLKKH